MGGKNSSISLFSCFPRRPAGRLWTCTGPQHATPAAQRFTIGANQCRMLRLVGGGGVDVGWDIGWGTDPQKFVFILYYRNNNNTPRAISVLCATVLRAASQIASEGFLFARGSCFRWCVRSKKCRPWGTHSPSLAPATRQTVPGLEERRSISVPRERSCFDKPTLATGASSPHRLHRGPRSVHDQHPERCPARPPSQAGSAPCGVHVLR